VKVELEELVSGAEAARRGDEADPAEGGLAEVERKDRGREGRSSFESPFDVAQGRLRMSW